MDSESNLFERRLQDMDVAPGDVLSMIDEGVAFIDRDYVVNYQNEAHKRLKGDREGELCYKAFRGRNGVCEECHMQECFADGKTRVFDSIQDCMNGTRHLRITGMPIFNANGEGVGMTQVPVDMTAQFEAEREARQNAEILTQIAENMDFAMYLLDADMSGVRYVNSAYEKIWGRQVQDVYENPLDWMASVHPDDIQELTRKVEARKGPVRYVNEYRVVRPDGGIRHIVDKGFPIFDAEGNHIKVCRGGKRRHRGKRERGQEIRF
jgi:PAS domain S-box-containing protein